LGSFVYESKKNETRRLGLRSWEITYVKRNLILCIGKNKLQLFSLYILLHKGIYSSGNRGEEEKDSTQKSSGTLFKNNKGTGSPGDPNNNKKKDNTKNTDKCIIKTPVLPSTFVKLYDDSNHSKLDMLRDLKNQAVIM
jgi:hypothetical protein